MFELKNYSYKHSFGQLESLSEISLHLKKGEGLLVTGKSGSGKSTLLNVATGLIPHYYKGKIIGSALIDGKETSKYTLAELGNKVSLMFQNAEVQFLATTVAEEIYMSIKCRGFSEKEAREKAQEQIRKFKLEHIVENSVTDLSEGQKQKVVLASITALNPELLLLDEPTANLDPASVEELKKILIEIKKSGISLIIADHRLQWVSELCENVMILDCGKTVWYGSYSDFVSREIYKNFGLRAPFYHSINEKIVKYKDNGAEDDVFTVKNLSFSYDGVNNVLENINFSLPKGKVSVLCDPSGAGKTTLAYLLAGMRKYDGEIYFGKKLADKKLLAEKTGLILQNADHQLYMNTVVSEMCLAINLCPKTGVEEAGGVLSSFGLKTLAQRHPQSLSGGEKQRLVVAAGVAKLPELIILDEPTSGLDGMNLNLMVKHVKDLASKNIAVLVITHDVELINAIADYKIDLKGDVNEEVDCLLNADG